MTTAHRATWKAMRGGLQEDGSFRLHAPSAATSSKDAPTEQTLKTRARPHARLADDDRDALRASLESAEAGVPPSHPDAPVLPPPAKRPRSRFAAALPAASPPAHADDERDNADKPARDDRDDRDERDQQVADADAAAGNIVRRPRDDTDSDEDSDSDSDDDEAELLAEVERLRQERAAAADEAAAAAADRAASLQERAAAAANPLLGDLNCGGNNSSNSVVPGSSAGSVVGEDVSDTASLAGSEMTGSVATGASVAYAVRRRWDDDVVFRAQAPRSDRAPAPRFLNDTTRNDFHRRFMRKYMR